MLEAIFDVTIANYFPASIHQMRSEKKLSYYIFTVMFTKHLLCVLRSFRQTRTSYLHYGIENSFRSAWSVLDRDFLLTEGKLVA